MAWSLLSAKGVSGVEVAKSALLMREGTKVLLTSGYAPEVVMAEGADSRFPVFTKPYRRHEFAATVYLTLKGIYKPAAR